MKKIIIIGFVVALVAASVLLWQHSKHPSDAKLARQITGAWTKDTYNPKTFSLTDPVVYTNTISPDGSFSYIWGHRSALVAFQGTWLVKDGELVTILDRVLWETGRWQPDTGYGIKFGYVLDETWQRTPRKVPASEIQILKLHGSTNWLIPYVAFALRDGTRRMLFKPETKHVPVCYFRCTRCLPSYDVTGFTFLVQSIC